VTEHSDALSLDKGVFTSRDPKRIAASLKRSAERSSRRKSSPFRSALSMLTFYINRAGKNLPASRKRTLMRAKDELPSFRTFSIPRVALRSKPCGSAAVACDRLSASARCGQAVRFRGRP